VWLVPFDQVVISEGSQESSAALRLPETIARFGRHYHWAVGLCDHLKAEARRLGVHRLHGLRWSQVAFAPSPSPCH